jgi:hypothetical protein
VTGSVLPRGGMSITVLSRIFWITVFARAVSSQ